MPGGHPLLLLLLLGGLLLEVSKFLFGGVFEVTPLILGQHLAHLVRILGVGLIPLGPFLYRLDLEVGHRQPVVFDHRVGVVRFEVVGRQQVVVGALGRDPLDHGGVVFREVGLGVDESVARFRRKFYFLEFFTSGR